MHCGEPPDEYFDLSHSRLAVRLMLLSLILMGMCVKVIVVNVRVNVVEPQLFDARQLAAHQASRIRCRVQVDVVGLRVTQDALDLGQHIWICLLHLG